jgi:apolipoprotein N-acyltransferase
MSEVAETNPGASPRSFQPLTWRKAVWLALVAAACFHAAYTPAQSGLLAFAIVGYVICLVQLARLRTTRHSFYTGLAVGFACFAPQLECFWRIFGAFAIALWLVLAFWIALFLALAHLALTRFGLKRGALLVPFLWTGLEYFRSELYYLKFAWLNVGFAFGTRQPFGIYGAGFCVAALSAVWLIRSEDLYHMTLRQLMIYLILLGILAALLFPTFAFEKAGPRMRANPLIAGVQLEFPNGSEIIQSLEKIVAQQSGIKLPRFKDTTNVDLIVLSEYTLDGEPTDALKDWCRTNQKFLIVGGKDSSPGTNYYNTAFVISTNGEVVFKQVKSVPIQFFKDGLPAPEQKLWDSPWGKIGICICYDLCYTRVTDELVRQGAQMIIAPTMDVAEWGRHQHELHARVAPVRAAEYGIPIFRLASSGISQGVDAWGRVRSSAPFPGEDEIIFFGVNLRPGRHGSLPLDRYLGPLSVIVTCVFMAWLLGQQLRRRKKDV